MNYSLIILVLILLFCIYQMNSKKEGFLVQDISKEVICPNNYNLEGEACINWKNMNIRSTNCPSGYPNKVANNKRCCPDDKPFYENKLGDGKTCRKNKLQPWEKLYI